MMNRVNMILPLAFAKPLNQFSPINYTPYSRRWPMKPKKYLQVRYSGLLTAIQGLAALGPREGPLPLL